MKHANAIRPLWLSAFEMDERRRMRLRDALVDALGFIDRLQNTKDDGWSTADVLRLQQIRSLAGEGFSVAAVAAAAQRETGAVVNGRPLPRQFRRGARA